MEIEDVKKIIETEYDCTEEGLDWQERKYVFKKATDNVFDFNVNQVVLPDVDSLFLNFDTLFLFGEGETTLGEVPREAIENLEIIKK